MSIPLESLEVGKCYLIGAEHVWRVVHIMPGGRVQFEARLGHQAASWIWRRGMLEARSFALQVKREVPCDWTSEVDG